MKLIIANWKLNPTTEREAIKLAKESDIDGLVICPPFPFLEAVAKVIKKAKLGAQDLFWEEKGAYTGEVSATQLKDLGVEYVITGHSDRRKLGETDEMIAKKIEAALKSSLTPVLCVGETQEERSGGKARETVERELKIGLSLVGNSELATRNLIVAYEPIWAIGTGASDTPEDMLEMVELIRRQASSVKRQVIYGGSVTSENAEEFLKHKEIFGALVGGASLNPKEIKKIVEIAKKYAK